MQGVSPRIERIRRRYQTGPAYISVERARHYTRSWRASEGQGLSRQVRVASAMLDVFRAVTHYVDDDDRVAGHLTEHFLGVPVDIERGVFNEVLAAELSKPSMLRHRARSLGRSLAYLARKRALGEVLRSRRIARDSGGTPLDLSLSTMQKRRINPFQICRSERRELVRELLPYWRGRTLADELSSTLDEADVYSADMRDLLGGMLGSTSRQVMLLSSCATTATIQGHLVLDFDRVLERGLAGMLADLRVAAERAALSAEQRDCLQALELALEGVVVYSTRLVEALERALEASDDERRRAELAEMLAVCRRVPMRPAKTFREAVQSMWTVKTAVELAHPINLHSLGRLDQQLYPFYAADLAAGRIDREQACELLEELLLKLMAQNLRPESNALGNFYHRFFGSTPVTIGGLVADGSREVDGTNELTYVLLDAAHRSKAITNVSVRISDKTPDALLARVAELMRDGTSSFSLFNDEVNVAAMARRGFSVADARDYAVMGCVETTCPGKTGSMSANALLLSRLLDITLRDGDCRTLAGVLHGEGVRSGAARELVDFEGLLDAFCVQARHAIAIIVRASNLRDQLYAERLPAPLISAFTEGCLDSARDVTSGGATYDLSGISMVNSIANVTDSLYVIKRLVFEQRRFDLETLLAAIDANFIGYDDVLREIRALRGKWGNGNAESDEIARRVMQALCDETHAHETFKGGPFVVFAISMTTHTIDGRLSIATPDGRRAATPFAASANPYNVERAGVTGALRSVAALPGDELMGCAVNMRFHPSGVGENRAARAKWVALIRTYFELGGSQLQPTVASAEALRAAQARPDEHRDLIVKVGGYSTYFVDLGPEIQREIIARTEHA